jgi:hypothetical protein
LDALREVADAVAVLTDVPDATETEAELEADVEGPMAH